MDLYLKAVFEAKEAETPTHDPPLENWLDVVEHSRLSHENALTVLKDHRKEHGC